MKNMRKVAGPEASTQRTKLRTDGTVSVFPGAAAQRSYARELVKGTPSGGAFRPFVQREGFLVFLADTGPKGLGKVFWISALSSYSLGQLPFCSVETTQLYKEDCFYLI